MDPDGLPEFFITDVRIEMLPGDCVRTTYIHPVNGDVVTLICPFSCWMETRIKFAEFQHRHAEGREIVHDLMH